MQEISISLYEVTKDELLTIKKEVQVLIYNSLTGTCSIEWTLNKKSIFYSKYASEYLHYFLLNKI